MAGEPRPTAEPVEGDPAPVRDTITAHAHDQRADGQAFHLLDDAALVEQARAHPAAFGVLYERHVRAIFAFSFSKLHDRTLAEDITSQTFLQALRALPRYQQRGVPFRSWLFRITANLIADRHRAQHPEQPLAGRTEEGAADEPDLADPRGEEGIHAWEQAEDFTRLIAGLTPEQRTVVQLRFAEGLQIAEIAARMARSEGSVKMLLMRALQNLRRRLATEAGHAG